MVGNGGFNLLPTAAVSGVTSFMKTAFLRLEAVEEEEDVLVEAGGRLIATMALGDPVDDEDDDDVDEVVVGG